MNHNTRELVIGIEWLIMFLGFGWLTHGTIKLARIKSRTWKSWPIPGRWVIASLIGAMAIVALDVVRLRFEPRFLEPHLASDPNSNWVVVLRALPIIPLIVLAQRTWRGITMTEDDEPNPPWDGKERRSGVERRTGTERRNAT